MQLSKNHLGNVAAREGIEIPDEHLLELPEKVLQFGTGVLLRGLPDYFIDKANKQGIFNGRIVVVRSTGRSNEDFINQDNLYTTCIRGLENGVVVEKDIINASISRVISAKKNWVEVLECAKNPDMKIVISNTTEVGIQLVKENIHEQVPDSFPGKLLAFLYERYKTFNGTKESGLAIIPAELITDNGSLLKEIVLQLAAFNKLDAPFISWVEDHNTFCNTLVDRIVPGKPLGDDLMQIESALGYTDALLTMSEPFSLWVIQGDDNVKEMLSFYKTDESVKIVPDITLYKELKLRILNGSHTFNCGLAFLSGFNLTREAVSHAAYGLFVKKIMQEVSDAIPYEIEENIKAAFAQSTFERFCNPFINHQWISITMQYTSKMKMRNIPVLLQHYKIHTGVPQYMATGFAAYLFFMKGVKQEENSFFGELNGNLYEIIDDAAGYFYDLWQQFDAETVADRVMKNLSLWDADLTQLPGFAEAVKNQLVSITKQGALKVVTALLSVEKY